MARPEKKGLDYFPVDCDMDDNVTFIDAKHEHGFKVIMKLWRKCYKYEGYFTAWNDRVKLMFARENNIKMDDLEAIVSDCFTEGIFSKELFDKYGILTSSGIQKRYLKIVNDSRRKNCKISDNHNLLSNTTEETKLKPSFTHELTELNHEESTQSKVKESKVNKSKLSDEVFESLKLFFHFENEMIYINRWAEIKAFLNQFDTEEKLQNFQSSFSFYKKYKEISGEKKHSFPSFISDGWQQENWEAKYNEFKKEDACSNAPIVYQIKKESEEERIKKEKAAIEMIRASEARMTENYKHLKKQVKEEPKQLGIIIKEVL